MIHPDIIAALKSAAHITVLTGAGISAESGVPTFRAAQTGLWANYRPEELASPEAFLANPRRVWEWYAWRRQLVQQAQPNPAHQALVSLEQRTPQFTLLTQNVDSLHQRAGSQNVIELHGNITRIRCTDEGRLIETWDETGELPPHCPVCGGLLRPDVVWFGETLPHAALQRALAAAQNCQVFLSIGTSGLVEPAASLPYLALRNQAIVIEINPELTPLSSAAAYVLTGKAGEVLPELIQESLYSQP